MSRVLCLLYHRVFDKKDEVFDLSISTEEFEKQIKFLKDNFDIVRFEEDWNKCERDSVCITFDDGYADNYINAFPILKKYEVPATIFISSGYIGNNKEYWWDDLTRLLDREIAYPDEFTLDDTLYGYTWETKNRSQRIELIKTLRWLLKMEKDTARYLNIVCQLEKWMGSELIECRKENLPMTLEQLKDVSKNNLITIGAHTVNHFSLGDMNFEQQEREITKSIENVSNMIGKEVRIFSYPFGSTADYNEDTFSILEENKIIKAATTKQVVWTNDCDKYTVPRVSIKTNNIDEFCKQIEEVLSK